MTASDRIIAVVEVVAPSLAVVVSHFLSSAKLGDIRVLVNGRLEEALAEIAALKAQIRGEEIHRHLTERHGVALNLERMHDFDHRAGVAHNHDHDGDTP